MAEFFDSKWQVEGCFAVKFQRSDLSPANHVPNWGSVSLCPPMSFPFSALFPPIKSGRQNKQHLLFPPPPAIVLWQVIPKVAMRISPTPHTFLACCAPHQEWDLIPSFLGLGRLVACFQLKAITGAPQNVRLAHKRRCNFYLQILWAGIFCPKEGISVPHTTTLTPLCWHEHVGVLTKSTQGSPSTGHDKQKGTFERFQTSAFASHQLDPRCHGIETGSQRLKGGWDVERMVYRNTG
jgi:hypothetical protein